MSVLVFDTETTGLLDFKRPSHAEGQPRMCSMTNLLCNDDGEIFAIYDELIRPDGWECTVESTAVNKITTEDCIERGVPVLEALIAWEDAVKMADVIVGYNIPYDLKMLRGELRRAGRDDQRDQHTTSCAMQAARKYCDRGPIKLNEAYSHIFQEVMQGQHTSSGDAEATRRIWFHLRAQDAVVIKPPKNPKDETPPATESATGPNAETVAGTIDDDNDIF